jgi:membrane associated rhomboid family serine protease
MLIPLRHENNKGRRWPVISLGLIVLNTLVFLGTHWQMDAQQAKLGEARVHILLLAAWHPELTLNSDAQELVDLVKEKNPSVWKKITSAQRQPADTWEAKMLLTNDGTKLQDEMDKLERDYDEAQRDSIATHYGYVPAHPQPFSYISSMFLHFGWMHLIGNMWFLWLAGAILEDTWGRVIYPIVYAAGGIIAVLVHAWSDTTSLTPMAGASGAVAALMGAFLVRFPQTKIEMLWLFGFGFRSYRFHARAFWLLPLWLLLEVFYGAAGAASGVAHWAHVGGFAFGTVAAVGLRYSGLEHVANQAIEAKVTWTADPAIVQATEKMDAGQLDDAIGILQPHVTAKPNDLQACVLLTQLFWRKSDIPNYHEALVKQCQLHLKAQDFESAWQDFGDYLNTGGERLPVSMWLELCRAAEGQQNFERAVQEYEALARAYPNERQSLLALMAAGRLSINKLSKPAEALRFYEAAAASPVPHIDWETNIQGGIREAQKALVGASVPALK